MKKILFISAICVVLIIGIGSSKYFLPFLFPSQSGPQIMSDGPISFLSPDKIAVLRKETKPFDFTAEDLEAQADECRTAYETGHFQKLIDQFKGASMVVYNFSYRGVTQDTGNYTVRLLPNLPHYTSLDQFGKDFAICAAGGERYPFLVNADWLLFVNSCSSGYDDGSRRPHGCEEIKVIVEPSLTLNKSN
ncbi:MAG: hypothetical protein V1846_03695 [Candidatus Komeilibacteria bacterium]